MCRVPATAMNCPSRTDPEFPEGYNQNPDALNADATTRADLGYVANTRARNNHRIDCHDTADDMVMPQPQTSEEDGGTESKAVGGLRRKSTATRSTGDATAGTAIESPAASSTYQNGLRPKDHRGIFSEAIRVIRKYLRFVGPGFMVAVAYIDPGELPLCTHHGNFHGLLSVTMRIEKVDRADNSQATTLPMSQQALLFSSSYSSSSLCPTFSPSFFKLYASNLAPSPA